MVPEEMYAMSVSGVVLSAPSPKPYPQKPPKCTDCTGLFVKAYLMRNAGASIHSYGLESFFFSFSNGHSLGRGVQTNKRESHSYSEILLSVGIDKPSQILVVTDVHQEANAAKAAGLDVLIYVHPGNAPLTENHGFQIIRSFAEI